MHPVRHVNDEVILPCRLHHFGRTKHISRDPSTDENGKECTICTEMRPEEKFLLQRGVPGSPLCQKCSDVCVYCCAQHVRIACERPSIDTIACMHFNADCEWTKGHVMQTYNLTKDHLPPKGLASKYDGFVVMLCSVSRVGGQGAVCHAWWISLGVTSVPVRAL